MRIVMGLNVSLKTTILSRRCIVVCHERVTGICWKCVSEVSMNSDTTLAWRWQVENKNLSRHFLGSDKLQLSPHRNHQNDQEISAKTSQKSQAE